MFYAYKDKKNIAGATTEIALNNLCIKLGFTNYTISKEPPKTTLTQKQQSTLIKKNLLKAVDDYMDVVVRRRGYDNIAKCVTYEGDEDPIFNAEGTAAKKWRSKIYRKCYSILAEVEAGKREVPTAQDLIAELPKIEWETGNE